MNQSGRRRPGQPEVRDGSRDPRMQNHRKEQHQAGHEDQPESLEPLLDYLKKVSRMAGLQVVGNLPDRV
jgi:hypothetical protein